MKLIFRSAGQTEERHRMAIRIVSRARMRRADEETIQRIGIPEMVLMENAGAALANLVLEKLAPLSGRAAVLCGPGNNGGDGLVVLRRLRQAGARAFGVLLSSSMKGAAGMNLSIARQLGLELRVWPEGASEITALGPGDVVLDAVFGTGGTRPPAGEALKMIGAVNEARGRGACVISADMPSGLLETGPDSAALSVRAHLTGTLGWMKRELTTGPGALAAGEVRVLDIGIPEAALETSAGEEAEGWLLNADDGPGLLPVRSLDFHKGNAGHVLVMAGAPGKSGAASMAALAALRSGAGLVTAAGREGSVAAVQSRDAALMGLPLKGEGPFNEQDLPAVLDALKSRDMLVIGPGMERGEGSGRFLAGLLDGLPVPAVLDADALNVLASSDEAMDALRRAARPLILTPHPLEMTRLTKKSVSEIQGNRIGEACRFAEENAVTLVLKGFRTVTAFPDGSFRVCSTGCPGMAAAGTGDVLAGCIAALALQTEDMNRGVLAAVLAHGLSGELAAQKTGQLGLTAADVLNGLGLVWARWRR